eukprot:2457174-Rhodomonas_salina.5
MATLAACSTCSRSARGSCRCARRADHPEVHARAQYPSISATIQQTHAAKMGGIICQMRKNQGRIRQLEDKIRQYGRRKKEEERIWISIARGSPGPEAAGRRGSGGGVTASGWWQHGADQDDAHRRSNGASAQTRT